MTKEKLQLFKDMYLKPVKHRSDPDRMTTRGEYIRIVLDGGIEFNTQLDFVTFDDDNELLHIICANDDPYSQYDFPFKIMSAPYEIIFVIESIVTNDNLDDILNDSFLGNVISDERKAFIREWMPSTNNAVHKANPMDADPYYTQNARTEHNGTKIINRDDGIKIATNFATKASKTVKSVKTAQSFLDAVANAEAGSTITLASNIELDETLKLEKPINIVGGGKTLTSSVKNAIEVYADATISGITINNTATNGRCVNTRKAVNLELNDVSFSTTSSANNQPITIGGSENGTKITIKNSDVSAGVAGYGIICFVESDIHIENCEINGYSSIYMKEGSENSTICVERSVLAGENNHPGEGNRFGTVVFETGDIDMSVDGASTISSTPIDDAYHTVFALINPGIDNVTITTSKFTGLEGQLILINGTRSVGNNVIMVNSKYGNDILECGFNAKKDSTGMAKIVDYSEVSVNGVAYETLADALTNAEDGATISFARDVETTDILKIEKAITLDGNGKTISGSANKTLELYADTNISNITIVNTSSNGRCVDTRSAVNLELDSVGIVASGRGNNQPITIGGSENGTSVTIKNSTVDAGEVGYGIISFVKSDIIIKDTNIAGYNAIYMKSGSEGSTIEVSSSTLDGINDCSGEDDRFGTVVFEAGDIDMIVDEMSEITSTRTNKAYHTVFALNNVDDVSINVDIGCVLGGDLLYNTSESLMNNSIIIPDIYKEAVWSNGYLAQSVDGITSVIKLMDTTTGIVVNGVECETLTDAIANAEAGSTVYVSSDITSSDIVAIDKPITIDGGGKVITGTAKKTFEVYADAKISNVTIDNSCAGGRCVDTRSAVKVELDSVSLSTSSKQNNQPITIGGSENGTELVLKNSKVSAGVAGYGVIAFVECDVTLENSTIEGYSCIYMKQGSDNSTINVNNCTMISENSYKDPSSHFGAIAIESDNCAITVDENSIVTADPIEGQLHEIILLYTTAENNNVVFKDGAVLNGDIINSQNKSVGSNIIVLSDEYSENVISCGFEAEEYDDEVIIIKDKA